MFTEAIIYYPADEKTMKQIDKEIANLHSAAAIKYMDSTLFLTAQQKVKILDSLMQDIITLYGLKK